MRGSSVRSRNNAHVLISRCVGVVETNSNLKSTPGASPGGTVPDGDLGQMMPALGHFQSRFLYFLRMMSNCSARITLFAVPKLSPDSTVIEKRKPLSFYARRAGWVG